jgi:23S rRNA (uracil1939-C5)-methyltransferase
MTNARSVPSEAPFAGTVRGLSSEGYGVVAHPDGRVFFVRGTWPGDEGRFRVERVEKRYGYAELVELTVPSPDRVTPPCPHLGVTEGSCGGCAWMIGAYASQLAHKEHRVRYALERAGLLVDGATLAPILGSPRELGYRNRAQFKTDGDRKLGFVSERSHVIADIKDCLALTAPMRALLSAARAKLPNPDWAPPSEGHVWTFLDLDEDVPGIDAAVLNHRRPFRQGNDDQNARMKAWTREHAERFTAWARTAGEAPVALELFSGAGNFTEVLAAAGFSRVRAYEVSHDCIRDLRARHLPGVTAEVWDLSVTRTFPALAAKNREASLLFLDPPRAGCVGVEKILCGLPRLQEVLYVSCDLATWTRDAARITRTEFRLVEAQPLDLFPQTPHVEILSRFVRR